MLSAASVCVSTYQLYPTMFLLARNITIVLDGLRVCVKRRRRLRLLYYEYYYHRYYYY